MAVDANTATLIAAYVLTTVAFFIIFLRVFLRRLKNESFKPDDWVMLASIPVYFMNTACYQVIIPNGSNLVAHSELLSQDQIDARVLGSKFALLGRPFYLTYVWMMKACILIYYTRLTSRTSELKLVKFTGALLVLTWIGCMLSFFLQCRPFNHYFQVYPDPGPDCTTAADAVITMGSTNIATDLLLMCIPLPIILRARLPIRTKIQLCSVFLVGIFVIGISITRIVIVLQNLTQINKLIWGQMECFAATLVANAPIIHSLYRHGKNRVQTRVGTSSGDKSSNGAPASNIRETGSSGIKLSRVGKMNSSSDSQWQILDDGPDASNRNSSESLKNNAYAISRTVEVRQDTQTVDLEASDLRDGKVTTAIYGKENERW